MKKRVVLCPNPFRDRGLECTRATADLLKSAGFDVSVCLIDERWKDIAMQGVEIEDFESIVDDATLVVTLGGDGTILHTARRLIGHNVPMVGVNLGTVGFLAELKDSEIMRLITAAEGNFTPSVRMMLKVEIVRDNQIIFEDYALNEIVMRGLGQAVHVSVAGDGRKIYKFMGDGIIVATPTGSTAYSLSAGGPLVEPTAENIILTPLCAHVLAAKSFVLAPDRVVTVVSPDKPEAQRAISVDGGRLITIEADDSLRIRKSGYQTLLAHVGYKGFYDIVYEKLGDSR